MSSAMMTRMLGFCCCANPGAPAVVAAAAKASSPDQMFFAKPIIHSSGFLNALEAAYAMLLEGLHQARLPMEKTKCEVVFCREAAGPFGPATFATVLLGIHPVIRSGDRPSAFPSGCRRGCRSPAPASAETPCTT